MMSDCTNIFKVLRKSAKLLKENISDAKRKRLVHIKYGLSKVDPHLLALYRVLANNPSRFNIINAKVTNIDSSVGKFRDCEIPRKHGTRTIGFIDIVTDTFFFSNGSVISVNGVGMFESEYDIDMFKLVYINLELIKENELRMIEQNTIAEQKKRAFSYYNKGEL